MTEPEPDTETIETLPPAPAAAAIDLVRKDGLWSRPDNLWPLDAAFAAELDRRLHVRQPRTIVEVGSGSSTLILARYAKHSGAKVYSLEHDERHAARVLAMLAGEGLADYVDIHLRPLVPYPLPITHPFVEAGAYAGELPAPTPSAPWYGLDGLPAMIDFVLVDGPPLGKGGRAAVLPALFDRLLKGSGGFEMLIDDAGRPSEREAINEWRKRWPGLVVRELPFGKNGAAMIALDGHPYTTGSIDASDVALTILTGERPDLLMMTLDALRTNAPGLLDTAQVIVMHNASRETDPATAKILDGLRCSRVEVTSRRTIGQAVGLLEVATRRSGAPFWLHLEDDWACSTIETDWLDHARALLMSRPLDLAQVRLRHYSERVLRRHMVTGYALNGRLADRDDPIPHVVYGEAHLTFNPFLARVGKLTRLLPTTGEHEFQQSAHALGLRSVAQLYPGAFTHLGAGVLSLRERLPGRGY